MKIYVSVSKPYSNTDDFKRWLCALEEIHKDIVVYLYKDVDQSSIYIKDMDIVIVYISPGYDLIGRGCYEEMQTTLRYQKPIYISMETNSFMSSGWEFGSKPNSHDWTNYIRIIFSPTVHTINAPCLASLVKIFKPKFKFLI